MMRTTIEDDSLNREIRCLKERIQYFMIMSPDVCVTNVLCHQMCLSPSLSVTKCVCHQPFLSPNMFVTIPFCHQKYPSPIVFCHQMSVSPCDRHQVHGHLEKVFSIFAFFKVVLELFGYCYGF